MKSADRRELEVPWYTVQELKAAFGGFHPLEILCLLLSFGLRLTLTELPVLGDHLAVAAVALAGVGAVAVDAAALPLARVLITLVHVCQTHRQTDSQTLDV